MRDVDRDLCVSFVIIASRRIEITRICMGKNDSYFNKKNANEFSTKKKKKIPT